eukprot:gene27959-34746_t
MNANNEQATLKVYCETHHDNGLMNVSAIPATRFTTVTDNLGNILSFEKLNREHNQQRCQSLTNYANTHLHLPINKLDPRYYKGTFLVWGRNREGALNAAQLGALVDSMNRKYRLERSIVGAGGTQVFTSAPHTQQPLSVQSLTGGTQVFTSAPHTQQ